MGSDIRGRKFWARLSDALKMLHRLIGEDIELSTVLEPGLESVKADPGQIEQILVNLSVNAHLPAVAEHAVSGTVRPAVSRGRRGTETILLTEDEPNVRALARGILEMNGYKVLEKYARCSTGLENQPNGLREGHKDGGRASTPQWLWRKSETQ